MSNDKIREALEDLKNLMRHYRPGAPMHQRLSNIKIALEFALSQPAAQVPLGKPLNYTLIQSLADVYGIDYDQLSDAFRAYINAAPSVSEKLNNGRPEAPPERLCLALKHGALSFENADRILAERATPSIAEPVADCATCEGEFPDSCSECSYSDEDTVAPSIAEKREWVQGAPVYEGDGGILHIPLQGCPNYLVIGFVTENGGLEDQNGDHIGYEADAVEKWMRFPDIPLCGRRHPEPPEVPHEP